MKRFDAKSPLPRNTSIFRGKYGMNQFFSKRNQVYPTLWYGLTAVEKHFSDMKSWQWETALYAVLESRLSLLKVLDSTPGLLITSYDPSPTLLEEAYRQETSGFSPEPWQALADWLIRCHALCGRLPAEGNLRDFLWNASEGCIIGLDLESFREVTIPQCGAKLIASLMNGVRENTSVRTAAMTLLAEKLTVPDEMICQEYDCLRSQQSCVPVPVSGIVLAGGHSRRMGQDKAVLTLCGKTLLEWQIEKLRALGVQDIMVSGASAPEGFRCVEDTYPARGPMGGIHACMKQAQNPCCLVLAVDIPLVPCSVLERLCRAHQQGVTVLAHSEYQEPLIGIYDRTLTDTIESLIQKGGIRVRALENYVPWNVFEYKGPEEFLRNCNRPEDYISVCQTAAKYMQLGLPLL